MQGKLSIDSQCTFCAIIEGSIKNHKVFEDDTTVAFLDDKPVFEGHVLIVPREHIRTFEELPKTLVDPIFSNVKLISMGVERAMDADGTFIAINNNVSQSVPHLHIHVVPRRFEDGLRGFFWPRYPYKSGERAAEVCEAIKKEISSLAR